MAVLNINGHKCEISLKDSPPAALGIRPLLCSEGSDSAKGWGAA